MYRGLAAGSSEPSADGIIGADWRSTRERRDANSREALRGKRNLEEEQVEEKVRVVRGHDFRREAANAGPRSCHIGTPEHLRQPRKSRRRRRRAAVGAWELKGRNGEDEELERTRP